MMCNLEHLDSRNTKLKIEQKLTFNIQLFHLNTLNTQWEKKVSDSIHLYINVCEYVRVKGRDD